MKNPNWLRDELILTLNLYFDLESSSFHNKHPKIIELSKILNKLPLHSQEQRKSDFRNPNGVAMKLNNFVAIDPDNTGNGLTSFSLLDEKIFLEFYNRKGELKRIAELILDATENEETIQKLYSIENEGDKLTQVGFEGEIILKLHKVRERDSKLSKSKKDKVFKETGKLQCEVCNFDFFETYGELGSGFIECHHSKQLSTYIISQKTTLNDLVLVCSNCHKMIHRNNGDMSINGLLKHMKF